MVRACVGEKKCCLCIPIQPGAIIISILGVLAGGVFSFVYARNIAGGVIPKQVNPALDAIPYVGMVCWMALALISFFGLFASWTAKPKLAAIYFWTLLAYYVIDLAFLVAVIAVALMGDKRQQQECIDFLTEGGFSGVEATCDKGIQTSVTIFIVALSFYKVISTYTTYAIFNFKRYTVAVENANNAKLEAARQPQPWQESDLSNAPRSWSKFED